MRYTIASALLGVALLSSASQAQNIQQAVDSVTANITGGVSQLRGQILGDQDALRQAPRFVSVAMMTASRAAMPSSASRTTNNSDNTSVDGVTIRGP